MLHLFCLSFALACSALSQFVGCVLDPVLGPRPCVEPFSCRTDGGNILQDAPFALICWLVACCVLIGGFTMHSEWVAVCWPNLESLRWYSGADGARSAGA